MSLLNISVRGVPAPQGSKKGIPIKRKGGKMGAVVVESAGDKVHTWRQDVRAAAERAMESVDWPTVPPGEPVSVGITFFMARPRSHYRTGRNSHLLKDSAPSYPTTKPDVDKLTRAILDALTSASVYADDSQVVRQSSSKAYADNLHPQGATITVRTSLE